MNQNQNNTLGFSIGIDTPFGIFTVLFSKNGLRKLVFPNLTHWEAVLRCVPSKDVVFEYRDWIIKTESAINSHLEGVEPSELPPLDITVGTLFQQQVWCELMKIKWGTTKTYGEVARNIGKPKASRAVGMACGANPIPIFIPCHRVVSADGSYGGFSAGLEWKKLLLEIESKNPICLNR